MDKLDMSLDDIIKKQGGNKKSNTRNQTNRTNKKPHPYQRSNNGASNGTWKHDKFQSSAKPGRSEPLTTSGKSGPLFTKSSQDNKTKAAPLSIAQIRGIATPPPSKKPQEISIKGEAGPCVLVVANLDRGATASDVEACFAKFGEVTNCLLFYDQYQQSTGNAEITFALKKHALDAITNLNNAVADGHVLSVQIKSSAPAPSTGSPSNSRPTVNKSQIKSIASSNQNRSSNLYSDRLSGNSRTGSGSGSGSRGNRNQRNVAI